MRKLRVIGVALVAALSGSDAPHAQSAPSTQRVWTGTWEEHDSWEGSSGFGRSQSQITFVYVQGRDEFGLPRWESRRLTWSAVWEDHRFDRVWVEEYGAADERGIYSNRSRMDIVTVCNGGGTLELGPAVAAGEDLLTPEQKDQLRPNCVTTYRQREAGPTPAPTHSKRDALDAPSLPTEDQLMGCSYEKTWLMGTRGAGSLSVSVSAPVTAVMEVDPDPTGDYGRFVPVPGEMLIFTASVPSGTARFRFELDPAETSRFAGYATNANIDDEVFFERHDLTHLRDAYTNDGPDFLFDPARFNRQDWSRVEPLVVETATSMSAAVVTVTAMDYGAVGKLRAFVKSEECGDWQPVPVSFGRGTRESVAIPMDEDQDLIADALEEYRGLGSGTDADDEPKGNGFDGDGFTAFEEYRGFMADGGNCRESFERFWHVRTEPKHKNLMVVINGGDQGLEVGLRLFDYATDLHVVRICGQHMIHGTTFGLLHANVNTPQSRVVNFTLQQQERRIWNGHTISLEPQRGVVLKTFRSPCQDGACNYGFAAAVDEKRIGPPKLTQFVTINGGITAAQMASTIVHEMGHAVGIPHHSDDVGPDWQIQYGRLNVTGQTSPYQRHSNMFPVEAAYMAPVDSLLIDPGPGCSDRSSDARYENGKFVGCYTARIVRRGEQNSGDYHCPIRYRFGRQSHYEPPDATARFAATRSVDTYDGGQPITVDHWSGVLLPYDMSRESLTDSRLFCTRSQGTLINAGSDQSNHSGDARRQKSCSEYIVVNDRAVQGGS